MNLLAFDTSTEVMSIAVSRVVQGRAHVWQQVGLGGAQASGHLIANVLSLLRQAELTLAMLDAICFGSGPGSFTGLRTACSVAQGLAFGVRLPVLPVESLLAVAEEARYGALAEASQISVTALLDARMDEMYAATYAMHNGCWDTIRPAALLRPEDLAATQDSRVLVGNVFATYGHRLAGDFQCIQALPTAGAMLRLAPQLLAQGRAIPPEQASPTYVRDKVAQTSAERAAEKALRRLT